MVSEVEAAPTMNPSALSGVRFLVTKRIEDLDADRSGARRRALGGGASAAGASDGAARGRGTVGRTAERAPCRRCRRDRQRLPNARQGPRRPRRDRGTAGRARHPPDRHARGAGGAPRRLSQPRRSPRRTRRTDQRHRPAPRRLSTDLPDHRRGADAHRPGHARRAGAVDGEPRAPGRDHRAAHRPGPRPQDGRRRARGLQELVSAMSSTTRGG